ncbi:2-oxo-3-hexenedioate decarboxylase [Pseudomonas asplenii]|uniref:2-oxo-3-hexenedioate decarboxylase n=1 Tax=Pseudomonas asplenii TaxID=53407 RepID=A0A1H6NUI8_9PSED|nr:fumarylacetoacetate hydrolase family protein [Pseudomonas fuscovaginae]SEI20256.1 2-oxo-3-hexenedioate decarboxylase [Pseudomonas fuscovaginae]
MSMIAEYAARLDEAARTAIAINQIDPESNMSLDDAYRIQAASMARRLGRGERQVGMKMGFTSRAKMLQMGIDDLIWGRLTSGMRVEEGSTIKLSSYVHPRVEPEIAFLLKRPLAGDVTASEALAAVEAIAPALEIIDSRYQNFKFSLPDVIADNASSSGFVIGAWNAPNSDIGNLGMVMSFDGKAQHMGSSAAILGNPLRALVAAARLAAQAGEPLQAGAIVMAGAATPAEWLVPDTYVRLDVQHLGSIGFHVQD